MTTLLVDTHALVWWSVAPERLSRPAVRSIEAADEIAVAGISWWEVAWMVHHGRITPGTPLRTWLGELSRTIRTAPMTPAVAATAAELPASFPGDPIDRLIYATALEHGWRLVTKDQRIRVARPGRLGGPVVGGMQPRRCQAGSGR